MGLRECSAFSDEELRSLPRSSIIAWTSPLAWRLDRRLIGCTEKLLGRAAANCREVFLPGLQTLFYFWGSEVAAPFFVGRLGGCSPCCNFLALIWCSPMRLCMPSKSITAVTSLDEYSC